MNRVIIIVSIISTLSDYSFSMAQKPISQGMQNRQIGSVTGLPLPRFVALKSSDINLRKGPGTSFPIAWKFRYKGYPMMVTAEFENWRKLEDKDGQGGWVHENFITGYRNAIVIGNQYRVNNQTYKKQTNELVIFRYPDENSYPMLRIQFGGMAKVKKCQHEWCQLKTPLGTGWARKSNLWGVLKHEEIS
jgi:SH3-like domain-containing protein